MSSKRQEKTCLFVLKVDFPDEEPVRIPFPKSFEDLFHNSEIALDLPRKAQQIFDLNYNQIVDLESIEPNSTVFVSCTKPYTEQEEIPIYKKRELANKTEIVLPYVEQPEKNEMPEDTEIIHITTANPFTVKDTITNSILALYNSLNVAQKAKVSNAIELNTMSQDTQEFNILGNMLEKMMGPTTSDLDQEIESFLINWCLERLRGIPVNEIQIAVSGSRVSGKSTILFTFTSVLVRKLIISGELQNYLVIPLNWKLYDKDDQDTSKLYNFILDATIVAIRASKPQLAPHIKYLHQWLASACSNITLSQMPPQIVNIPGFPYSKVYEVGLYIYHQFNSKELGAAERIQAYITFPSLLAAALNIKDAIFIFDNFDSTDFDIIPRQINLGRVIGETICGVPYIISTSSEEVIKPLMDSPTSQHFFTSGIIPDDFGHTIYCSMRQSYQDLSIQYSMCHGSITACVQFRKVFKLLRAFNESHERGKRGFSKAIMSRAEKLQRTYIKEELVKLIRIISFDMDETDLEGLYETDAANLKDCADPEMYVV